MGENEKESTNIFKFPKWAKLDKNATQMSKKLKIIKETTISMAEKSKKTPGPSFWKSLKARIDHLKKNDSSQD